MGVCVASRAKGATGGGVEAEGGGVVLAAFEVPSEAVVDDERKVLTKRRHL
jgi:hypothetical protein